MVRSANINWPTTMFACAVANQSPYLEDDPVPSKQWIGKAKYIMTWGKEIANDL